MHYLKTLIAALLLGSAQAQNEEKSLSERMAFACQHKPTLSFCANRSPQQVSPSSANSNGRPTEHGTRLFDSPSSAVDVPDEVRRHLEQIAHAVERYRRNPFDGSDLHEKEGRLDVESEREEIEEQADEVIHTAIGKEQPAVEEEEREGEREEGKSGFGHRSAHAGLKEVRTSEEEESHFTADGFLLYKGDRSEYCEKYRDNYAYFCIGDSGGNQDVVKSFCPSYRSACGGPAGSAPADPFSKKISVVSATAEVDEVTRRQQVETQRLELLKKRYPCKPDCDSRIHPHCTAECKCDYIYPSVQKFCNPPPLPMFLNTCRLWYYSCPKYERYHYASQYIYSKAEKGKVLPGPARNPNPFGLPQPASPTPVAAASSIPAARAARTQQAFILQQEPRLRDLPTPGRLIVPPEVPRAAKLSEAPKPAPAQQTRARPVQDVIPFLKMFEAPPKRRRSKAAAADSAARAAVAPAAAARTQQLVVPPEPYSDRKDAAPTRALQSRTFPVLPSDAAYGAGSVSSDPFTAFDGLTDSKGIAHRPRSRSPFTKPGLWEANPDDPHNRDHANKWWYHPESVGADWLNGQATWGAHWAVPAAGVGGTNGFSAIHFPSIGTFLGIPDDYD